MELRKKTMESVALSLLPSIADTYPDFTYQECFSVWLGLTSVGRSEVDATTLLKSLGEADSARIQKALFDENVAYLNALVPASSGCIAVWWRPGCFGSQLTPLAKRINAEAKYRYLGVIATDYVMDDPGKHLPEFSWGWYLAIPSEEHMAELGFLDAIILSEDYLWKSYLPRHVIRIAQPHGLDVPVINTINKYGGPIIFNYVLSPMKQDLPERLDMSIFPAALIEHASDFICSIPAGYPKLDQFTQACEAAGVSKKIIYHVSILGLETPHVKANIGRTLQVLLDSFPDRIVLFRPDPRDHDNDEISSLLARFSHEPRFVVSKASSYVEDYADAELLVTHRDVTAHTFAYASGRPVVVYDPPHKARLLKWVRKTAVGYKVFTEKQLVSTIKKIHRDLFAESGRIRNYRDSIISQPGTSLDYVTQSLDFILTGKRNPAWRYFQIAAPRQDVDEVEAVHAALKSAIGTGAAGDFVCLAEAAAGKYPQDPLILFYAALLNGRVANAFRSNVYFKFWYRAVLHMSRAMQLKPHDAQLVREMNHWLERHGFPMALSVQWAIDNGLLRDAHEIGKVIEVFNQSEVGYAYYASIHQDRPLISRVSARMFRLARQVMPRSRKNESPR